MQPKDAREFFLHPASARARALLKFSRIRPISGQRAGDLGCLPSTADYDSRRLRRRCGELECVPASRPDLIWIIHGYVTDVHAFYAVRTRSCKKKRTSVGKGRKERCAWRGAYAMRSRKRALSARRIFAKLYSCYPRNYYGPNLSTHSRGFCAEKKRRRFTNWIFAGEERDCGILSDIKMCICVFHYFKRREIMREILHLLESI